MSTIDIKKCEKCKEYEKEGYIKPECINCNYLNYKQCKACYKFIKKQFNEDTCDNCKNLICNNCKKYCYSCDKNNCKLCTDIHFKEGSQEYCICRLCCKKKGLIKNFYNDKYFKGNKMILEVVFERAEKDDFNRPVSFGWYSHSFNELFDYLKDYKQKYKKKGLEIFVRLMDADGSPPNYMFELQFIKGIKDFRLELDLDIKLK